MIDPTPEALEQFVAAFDAAEVYIGPDPQEALEQRDMFNLIDHGSSGWKVDLIVPEDSPFGRSQLERRARATVLGMDVWVASPEDTVLAKLQWATAGGSERQLSDAAGVLEVQGEGIDNEYLDSWAVKLGVEELLTRTRVLAETPPG